METARGLILGVSLLVLVSVATGIAVATGYAPRPHVERVDHEFASVNETATIVDTDLVIDNPYPVSPTFEGFTVAYVVETNAIPMAHGTHHGFRVERGTTTVDFTTWIPNERISRWWRSHVRRGERTRVTVEARIDPPVLSREFHAQPVSRRITTDVLAAFESTANRRVRRPVAVVGNHPSRGRWPSSNCR